MKKLVNSVAILLCLGAGSALLKAQASAATPAKIGVVNMQEAIISTAEGKKGIADLQKKYQPRQQDLLRLQTEIQGIQDQLQKQAATLSDEEQRRLNRDLEEKQKLLKRSTEDANTDFGADRDEAIRRVGQKMIRLIGEYAQQNGYTLIIEGGPQMPIYYVVPQIDITEEMVKRYDAANPAEAATTGGNVPASAATRPASTKPPAPPKAGDKPKP